MDQVSLKSDRFDWIDIAKGIGILLVVIGHANVPSILAKIIYACHMPLFFFISGYLFNYDKYQEFPKTFIEKKSNSLLLPYFFTYIGLYVIFITARKLVEYIHIQPLTIGLAAPNEIILSILLGNTIPNQFVDKVIWFLPCLFCGNILLYLIVKSFKNETLSICCCLVLAIMGYQISRYAYLPWSFDVALVSLAFMYLGYLFKKYSICHRINKVSYSPLVLVLFLIFAILNNNASMNDRLYGNFTFFFLASLSGILFFLIVSMNINSRVLIFLGENSIVIFIFHFLVYYPMYPLFILNKWFYYLIMDNWVLHSFAMLTLSMLVIYIIKSVAILDKIYYGNGRCSNFRGAVVNSIGDSV